MKGRALGVVAVTGLVAAYLLWRAYDLAATGTVRGALLGAGVLLLVLVGGLLVVGEVRLAAASERLGRLLYDEGFVEQDLPVSERGRVDREAADALFAQRKAEVEQAPQDWRAWFRLASAYDMAGDASRGRRAMRRAVALQRLG